MMTKTFPALGKLPEDRRLAFSMSCKDVAAKAGVSISYNARVEKGTRFPSAPILRKLAGPLSLDESILFKEAGYLSQPATETPLIPEGNLDLLVGRMFSQKPVEIQRLAVNLALVMKSAASSYATIDMAAKRGT
jgi:transcriptional regulator with XRE-family HTH domain